MGYPITDAETALLDVKIRETYSDVMAFKLAASMAFRNASEKAQPVILEPRWVF
jgi:elongation factor G